MSLRLTLRAIIGLWLAFLPIALATFPALATPPSDPPRLSKVRAAYLRHWVQERIANLITLGLCLKLYTEYFKDASARNRGTNR